ncbi:MAG: hypothetical protein AB8E82_04095 [Aureispira sp.]
MQYLFSVIILLFVTLPIQQVIAQNNPSFLYRQNELPQLEVSSKSDLSLAFYATNPKTPDAVTVHWTVGTQTIALSTSTITPEEETFQVATFTFPLLDIAIEGHIEWAQAVLQALDDQPLDSIIMVEADLVLADSTLKGVLPISFKGGWNVKDEFWNRAAQYKLLKQQLVINDSVKFWKRQVARTENLIALNKKAKLTALSKLQDTKNSLALNCQDTASIDSLLVIEKALNEGLEKARNGAAITNPQKMQLAQQTTMRSQLLTAINGKNNPKCKESLSILLTQQNALINIQKQNMQLKQQYQQKQQTLKKFQQADKSNKQQLSTIATRLNE